MLCRLQIIPSDQRSRPSYEEVDKEEERGAVLVCSYKVCIETNMCHKATLGDYNPNINCRESLRGELKPTSSRAIDITRYYARLARMVAYKQQSPFAAANELLRTSPCSAQL